jgi:hypothetical protein
MQKFVLAQAEGILGPKKPEETGERKRGHNEDLRN